MENPLKVVHINKRLLKIDKQTEEFADILIKKWTQRDEEAARKIKELRKLAHKKR